MERGDRGAPSGQAWRIRNYDEVGEPQEGSLTPATAKRLRWIRSQCRGNTMCDAWEDPGTGEVYLTPREEPAEPAPRAGPERGKGPRKARGVPRLLDP